MNKNGYVNFNFLDSKPNINNILVGLDLDYSNILLNHLQNYWKNWFQMKKNGFG